MPSANFCTGANYVHPRITDLKYFNTVAKSIIYADLLEKLNKLILYQNIEQGGLGLICHDIILSGDINQSKVHQEPLSYSFL